MPHQFKEGKKRFGLVLDEKPYMEWRAVLKEMGAPEGTAGLMINDFIKGQAALFSHFAELKKDGKPITFSEALIGYAKMNQASGVDDEI